MSSTMVTRGLFVELYLPKKAHYQCALYDALASGFNLEVVQKHLRDRNDIGLYVNGYVIFTICDKILRLFEQGRISKVEDEVWVTSLRCLAVNRVLTAAR